ncbi:MAG: A/G-specific adenine glycosylase, partial [Planctomycetes bacterium]|nr:A/G-specific adenine glycosylase [Planctomycetota bacterium]
MTEEAQALASRLLQWYGRRRRDLPWRRRADPYAVWLSEVMLQQTRVETVVEYYGRFLERFPTIDDLAAASEEQVLALWSGLGYYRRARSLLAGARQVVERHGGRFPRALADALSIPGVGPYTAAAILSIAYGEPHPVVDGNVERVITRLCRIPGNPRQAPAARRIREIAASWLPAGRSGDFNQAMMELGATVCTARAPRCDVCPVASWCAGPNDPPLGATAPRPRFEDTDRYA